MTPFSPRALDRGFAAVAVALARHGLPELTTAAGRGGDRGCRKRRSGFVAEALADRAAGHDPSKSAEELEALARSG